MSLRHRLAIEWTGGAGLALGSFIFFGPYATGHLSGAPMWSNWITGAVVAVAAMYDMHAAEEGHTERVRWPGLVHAAGGMWIIVSGGTLAMGPALIAYNLALGATLLAVAGFTLWAGIDARYEGALASAR